MTVGILAAAFLGGAFAEWIFGGSGEACAAQAGGSRVVRAQAFVLVDAAGREWGRLAVVPGGGGRLSVLDQEGKERLRVGSVEEPAGWGLRAYDEDGQNRIIVGLWTGAASGMRLYDGNGTKRAGLGLTLDGQNQGLGLIDANGTERLGVGMGPGGGGDFVMKDWEGKDIWRASYHVEDSD